MGTRADFYVGMEWLGSLAFDGYRVHEMTADDAAKAGRYQADSAACWLIKTATSEASYRSAVADLLRLNDDATLPEQGWPWPWETSATTDMAYVFDGKRTKAYSFGSEILPGDAEGNPPDTGWPDMTAIQNFVIGTARDGVIVVSGK